MSLIFDPITGQFNPSGGGGGGSGTVTSVAMTVPSILTVSGSPITTSGTLALALANQSANTVFAGPSSGGAAAPTFRALAAADVSFAELVANKATDFSTLNNTKYPTTLATYDEIVGAANGLASYYLYSTASDIATYYKMMPGIPGGGGFGLNVTGALDGDLLGAFATEPNVPGVIVFPSGVFKLIGKARQTAGTQSSQIYFELYKRDTGATETLLGTGTDSIVLTGTSAEVVSNIIIPTSNVLNATDRIVVKIRVTVTGVGTAPDVVFDIQGVNYSRFDYPGSSVSAWKLDGNAATAGTAKLGTTDAQPFSIVGNNIEVIQIHADYAGFSSSVTIVPADATGINQFSLRTYVSPIVSTTGASHTGFETQLVWDNGNLGYGNSGGNLLGSSFSFTHNGDGTINYASTISAAGYFNNTGTTTQFKGVTSENSIGSGATVSDYYGMVSGLNTTGGIVPVSNSISCYGNFTDSTIGQATGINQTLSFSGTTANSQGVNGYSSFLQFNDTTTVTNSVYGFTSGIDLNNDSIVNGLYGFNSYFNIRDNSQAGFLNAISVGINHEDASVSTGTNGVNVNIQYANTSDGGDVNIANLYVRTYDTSNLNSLTSINTNPELEGSSTLGNYNGINLGGQIRGNCTVTNINTFSVSTQMSGNAAATNFTPVGIFPQITGSATLTNGFTVVNVAPTVSNAAGVSSCTGLNVDLTNVTLSAAAIAAGEKLKAIGFTGAIEGGLNYTIPSAAGFFQQHYIGGSVIVANGAPVSTFGFGLNMAQGVELHDDWILDGAGLGFCNGGFVGTLAFDTGTTMARWTGALGGAGNPSGAGTLTDAIMFRAAGILPQGGSLTVTNMYGFQVDPNLYGLLGINVWGFYEDTATVQNHFSKLAIGTASKTVSSTDVALEIGNSKMFLPGSGSTATKNALTAIESGVFYDSTLKQLQFYNGTSWVSPSGGTYGQYNGTSLIDGSNQAFTLPNTPIQSKAVWVYFNGEFQFEGIGYTISGATITTIPTLTVSETMYVVYIY